jgi:hypothetical protein
VRRCTASTHRTARDALAAIRATKALLRRFEHAVGVRGWPRWFWGRYHSPMGRESIRLAAFIVWVILVFGGLYAISTRGPSWVWDALLVAGLCLVSRDVIRAKRRRADRRRANLAPH